MSPQQNQNQAPKQSSSPSTPEDKQARVQQTEIMLCAEQPLTASTPVLEAYPQPGIDDTTPGAASGPESTTGTSNTTSRDGSPSASDTSSSTSTNESGTTNTEAHLTTSKRKRDGNDDDDDDDDSSSDESYHTAPESPASNNNNTNTTEYQRPSAKRRRSETDIHVSHRWLRKANNQGLLRLCGGPICQAQAENAEKDHKPFYICMRGTEGEKVKDEGCELLVCKQCKTAIDLHKREDRTWWCPKRG